MKLYYAPGTCSLAVHIALREAALTPELARVDLMTHRLATGGDYHDINPRGYVPTLELDDGSRHTEAAALLQYVGELAPASGLLPPAGKARFEVLQWLTFISSELHKTFGPLWHKETPDATRKDAKDKLAKRFAEINEVLGTRQWLAGDSFSAADAYGFTIVGWCNLLGISLNPYPNVGAWLGRVAARPAVHAALVAEGLVKQ
jgi:glutathione S-transferase